LKSNHILFVLNSNGVGGAEVSVKRMVELYFKDSQVVTMWEHPNYQKGFWDSLGSDYTHLVSERLSPWSFLKSLVALRAFIDRSDYQIIQTQLKGADLILGMFKMIGLIRRDIKLICCIHNSYSYYYEGSFMNKLVGKIHKFLVSRYFEKVVVISRQDLDLFKLNFANKLEVIENAIKIPKTVKDNHFTPSLSRPLSIAMIGNVKERKGYDKLEQLAHRLDRFQRDIQINIAGGVEDEGLLDQIQSLERKVRHVSVNYVGKIQSIFDFLIQSDMLLSLSREEGLPISVLEAMAVNLPLILSDIPGHRMVIPVDNQKRILFGDLDEAAALILGKFESEIILQEELKLQSSVLKERFDFYAMCGRYEEIYEEVYNNGK
jgi:glycosyltransferase involved in cell wall biosynthesis